MKQYYCIQIKGHGTVSLFGGENTRVFLAFDSLVQFCAKSSFILQQPFTQLQVSSLKWQLDILLQLITYLQVSSLQQQLDSYSLPPDLNGARMAVLEARHTLNTLMKDMASVQAAVDKKQWHQHAHGGQPQVMDIVSVQAVEGKMQLLRQHITEDMAVACH